MAWQRAAVLAALSLFTVFCVPSWAQDVTLTSRDGSVEVSGTLLGFDGEFYRVETRFGELTVDGSGVLCDGPGCPDLASFVAELTLSGSSAMAEVLLPALIEGFALRKRLETHREPIDDTHFLYELINPATRTPVGRFTFRVTNTDEGFADLLANEADVVMALREIRPDEKKRAYESGMGDMTRANRSRVLALDAMVPVVAPGNPITKIAVPQLARIFSGELRNWSELGGPDAPIAVHMPEAGSGLSQAVEDRLLFPAGLQAAADIQRHPRSSAMSRAVTADPFAIGIASYAETGTAKTLTLTGSCGYSLRANRRSIKTEDYPLTSPMFLYLPARRMPQLAREFLSYVRSPAAQIVIRRSGFVDQAPERIPVSAQGRRLANAIQSAGSEIKLEELQRLVTVMEPMRRLTVSFRFETGSTRPDAQSRSNIAQLARSLEAGIYDGRELLFVGFSDGEGAAAGNRRIALKRADAVREAVIQAAEITDFTRVSLSSESFGEALPMACDDSAWGRQVNRRVEVWIR
jgi:phosphate transport system substrate-binding protein